MRRTVQVARILLISMIASLVTNIAQAPSWADPGDTATLASINLATPQLNGDFAPIYFTYWYEAPTTQETLTFTAEATFENSTIEINGTVETNSISIDIPLDLGSNQITVNVSRDDLLPAEYNFFIWRGKVQLVALITNAVPLTHNAARVSFSQPPQVRAFPTTSYTLQSDKGELVEVLVGSGPTSGIFRGLIPGATYQFRVRATNSNGSSEWSEYFEPITLPTAPVADGKCAPEETITGPYTLLKFTNFVPCEWQVPWGISSVDVLAVGGGGGGGGANIVNGWNGGGGGGGGGEVRELSVAVNPGSSELVSVGSGGMGGLGSSEVGVDAYNGGDGGNTYFGSTIAVGGQGGEGGHYGGDAQITGGDGGGANKFEAASEYVGFGSISRDSVYENNPTSCTAWPRFDSDYAAAGCNYWEGAGGGVGAAGVAAFNAAYGTFDGGTMWPNIVLKMVRGDATYFSATDLIGTGGTGGSGGPGISSSLSGETIVYGGGGGGGGSMGGYFCGNSPDFRRGQGGFGVDGGGDGAMCGEIGYLQYAEFGEEGLGGGGGGGGYVRNELEELVTVASFGGRGGSGVLYVRFLTANVTSNPNLPYLVASADSKISRSNNELVCSAGKFRYGKSSDLQEVVPTEFSYKLLIDGKEFAISKSVFGEVSWKVAELPKSGLVTCEVIAYYVGQSALNSSTNSKASLISAETKLRADLTKANADYEKFINNLPSKLKALLASIRKDWQSARDKVMIENTNKREVLLSKLESGALSKKEFVSASKSLNRATTKALNDLWVGYRSSMSDARSNNGVLKEKALIDLALAKSKANSDYAKSLEDAGYGITLG